MATMANVVDPPTANEKDDGLGVHVLSSNCYCYKTCRILYSTQSGRARGCARRTSRILQQQTNIVVMNGKNKQGSTATFDDEIGLSMSLQDYCKELKQQQQNNKAVTTAAESSSNNDNCFLLLFVSTTGDGEHTDTIQQTWHQLRQKSLPNDLFQGISFAIFNLGDRAYGPQFCAAGRKLTIRLLQLGATLLCDPGYGDDGTSGGGVFADLDVWLKDQLLKTLLLMGTTTTTRIKPSSTSSSSRPQNFSLPYKITIANPSSNDENLPQQEEEEWQDERFASSYQAFFARLAPVNAYTYHHHHHHHEEEEEENDGGAACWIRTCTQNRETATNHNGNDDKDTGMKKSVQQPLLARVVENRRITASDWEQQDTRHVRLVLPENIIIAPTTTATTTTSRDDDDVTTLLMLPYQAGDVVSIMPSNTTSNVERFLAVLPAELQELANVELEIQNTSCTSTSSAATTTLGIYGYDGWPKHCTLRGWLTYCADIHALPDREDLHALSHYCSPIHAMGHEQCQKLQSLSESSGASLYTDYILREKRSWADVLYDFDSLRAPGSLLSIQALLALLSPIRPREFSIASSPMLEYQRIVKQQQQQQQDVTTNHDKQQQGFGIDLCVAVVRGTTARGRKYHGLCSHYISQLQTSNEGQQQQQSLVRMWIRPGSFSRLPLQTKVDSDNDATTHHFVQPVLYIGAGTGIAPLRGLIQERQAQLNRADSSSSCAITAAVVEPAAANDDEDNCWKMDDILLFGCRQEKSDYYYQSEWQKLQDQGRLHVMTAFSQDQWHKIYVQQVLRKADPTGKKLATHLMKKAGCIYIAGGPKMASAIKEEIVELLTQQLGAGNNEKQAQQLLVRLQRAGRFSVEAWS